MRAIRGIKYVSPFAEPMRFASIMLRCNLVRIKRVPLHKPFVGAKFRNNIIMHPGFKFNLYGGIPVGVKKFHRKCQSIIRIITNDIINSLDNRFPR
ncbi:hypothetical protein AVEN_235328-1 [Araneus ventricosus]|uniref:Uncharacterized protein n=1 Tax=Araneus ventricosus TaxID=182803 RepID=A0A4Y2A3I5_ARAVE|nr:hypothetical protein AVEN_235328-1 [Araneus ventricosus]